MDPDLKLELFKATDESVPQRDGTFTKVRRYDFYLGKYGPFTERVTLDNFDDGELMRRVDKLRAHLRQVQV
jgi:hypothetical protein